jgi:hypothetical protein
MGAIASARAARAGPGADLRGESADSDSPYAALGSEDARPAQAAAPAPRNSASSARKGFDLDID